ncbi:MAG: hypothetical protein KatS3mg129_1129 [Leptospiraceae bacterium]|nr:MAG: hypothetical protein KatS3mg129_1129 [Leptospiraceae bacterium]
MVILIYHKQEELYERLNSLIKNLIYIPSIPDKKIPIRLYLSYSILKALKLPIRFKNYHLGQTKHISFIKKIIIHPGAGSKNKIWSIENYIKLIEFLLIHNKKITLIEGPAEQGILNIFQKEFKNKIHFIRIQSPFEFINQIKRNDFYIGNDSGLTHLASFLGISGIAIFGSTDPWIWNPVPVISCLYENKKDGIFFPSLNFIISYLKTIGII